VVEDEEVLVAFLPCPCLLVFRGHPAVTPTLIVHHD